MDALETLLQTFPDHSRGDKLDFELFCLAVSAINGCELCVRTHARVLLAAGTSKEELAECVRVAATLHAAAVATSQAEGPARR